MELENLTVRLNAEMGGVLSQLDSFASKLRSATQAPDMSGISGAFSRMGDSADKSARQAGSALDGLKSRVQSAGAAYEGALGPMRRFSDAAQAVVSTQNDAEATFQRSVATLNEVGDAYKRGEASVHAYTRAQEEMNSAARNAGVSLDPFKDRMDAIAMKTQALGGSLQSLGSTLTLAVTAPLAGVGLAALKTAGDLEQNTVAFKTLLGSAEAAQSHLAALRDFAAKTPFEFPDLISASKRMQALGFEAKEVLPTLKIIGDTAAGMGSGAEGINRITLALGQMKAKGVVSAEEMRQLAEAGIPAWKILAKTLETDVAGAMKLVEQRAVDSATAVPAILAGMNEKFGGLMEAQSKTMLGIWSNLKDKLTFTLTDIGTSLAPAAKSIMEHVISPMLGVLQDLAHSFAALPLPIKDIIIAFGAAAIAAGPLLLVGGKMVEAYGQVAKTIPLAIDAITKMGGASVLAAGKQGVGALTEALQVAAPAIIAAGVAFAAWKFSDISGRFKELGESFTHFKDSLGESGSILQPFTDSLKNAKDGLEAFWNGLKEGNPQLKESVDGFSKMWKVLSDTAPITAASTAMDKLKATVVSLANDGFKRLDETMSAIGERFGNLASASSHVLGPLGQLSTVFKDLSNLFNVLGAGAGAQEALYKKLQSDLGKTAHAAAEAAGGFEHINVAALTLGSGLSLTQAKFEANSVVIENLKNAQERANEGLIRAVAAYDKAKEAGKGTAAAAEAVAVAQDKAQAATKQLTSYLDALAPVATKVVKAHKEFLDPLEHIPDAATRSANATAGLAAKEETLADRFQKAQIALNLAIEGYKKHQNTLQDVAKAADLANKAAKALNDEVARNQPVVDAREMWKGFASTMEDFNAKLSVIPGLFKDVAPPMDIVRELFNKLKINLDEDTDSTGRLVQGFEELLSKGTTSAKGLQTVWDEYSKVVNQLARTDMPAAVEQVRLYTAEQVRLNESASIVATALETYEGWINKLAKVSLPDAIKQQQNYIGLLEKTQAPILKIYEAQQKLLQLEAQNATEHGKNASAYIIAADLILTKQQAMVDKSTGLAQVYAATSKSISESIKGIGETFTDIIFQADKAGQHFADLGKKIAKEFANDVINIGLKPLNSMLQQLAGYAFPGVNDAIKNTGGGIAALATQAGSTASIFGQLGNEGARASGIMANLSPGFSLATTEVGAFSGATKSLTSSLGNLKQGITSTIDAMALMTIAAVGAQVISTLLEKRDTNPNSIAQIAIANKWDINDPAMQERLATLIGLKITPQILEAFNKLTGVAQQGNATAADIATAIKSQQDAIAALKAQQTALNNELITVMAKGTLADRDAILAQLKTVEGKISAANSVLDMLNGTVADGLAKSAATAEQIATAVTNEKTVLEDMKAQAQSLTNQMIAAAAMGNHELTKELAERLDTLNGQIKDQSDMVDVLVGVQNTMAAQAKADGASMVGAMTGVKASTDQMAAAITNTQNTLQALKDLQSQLNNDLIRAVATGNTELVGVIQKQLTDVGTKISSTETFLKQIQAIADQAAKDARLDAAGTRTDIGKLGEGIRGEVRGAGQRTAQATLTAQQAYEKWEALHQKAVDLANEFLKTGNAETAKAAAQATEDSQRAYKLYQDIAKMELEKAEQIRVGIAGLTVAIRDEGRESRAAIERVMRNSTDAITQAVGRQAAGQQRLAGLGPGQGNADTGSGSQAAPPSGLAGLFGGPTGAQAAQTALTNLNASLTDLKAQQQKLSNDWIAALAAKNYELAASIHSDLNSVEGKIRDTEATIKEIQDISKQQLAAQNSTTGSMSNINKLLADTNLRFNDLIQQEGNLQAQIRDAVTKGDAALEATLRGKLTDVQGQIAQTKAILTQLNATAQQGNANQKDTTGAVNQNTGGNQIVTGINTDAIYTIGEQITTGVGLSIQQMGDLVAGAVWSRPEPGSAMDPMTRLTASGGRVDRTTVSQFFGGVQSGPDGVSMIRDPNEALSANPKMAAAIALARSTGKSIPLNFDAAGRLVYVNPSGQLSTDKTGAYGGNVSMLSGDTSQTMGSVFYGKGNFDAANISRQDAGFVAESDEKWKALIAAMTVEEGGVEAMMERFIAALQGNIDRATGALGEGTVPDSGAGAGVAGGGTPSGSGIEHPAGPTADELQKATEKLRALQQELSSARSAGASDEELRNILAQINMLVSKFPSLAGGTTGTAPTGTGTTPSGSAPGSSLPSTSTGSSGSFIGGEVTISAASLPLPVVITNGTIPPGVGSGSTTIPELPGVSQTDIDAALAIGTQTTHSETTDGEKITQMIADLERQREGASEKERVEINEKIEHLRKLLADIASGVTKLDSTVKESAEDVSDRPIWRGDRGFTGERLPPQTADKEEHPTTPSAPPPPTVTPPASLPEWLGIDKTKPIAEQIQAAQAMVAQKTLSMNWSFLTGQQVQWGQQLQREILMLQSWLTTQGASSILGGPAKQPQPPAIPTGEDVSDQPVGRGGRGYSGAPLPPKPFDGKTETHTTGVDVSDQPTGRGGRGYSGTTLPPRLPEGKDETHPVSAGEDVSDQPVGRGGRGYSGVPLPPDLPEGKTETHTTRQTTPPVPPVRPPSTPIIPPATLPPAGTTPPPATLSVAPLIPILTGMASTLTSTHTFLRDVGFGDLVTSAKDMGAQMNRIRDTLSEGFSMVDMDLQALLASTEALREDISLGNTRPPAADVGNTHIQVDMKVNGVMDTATIEKVSRTLTEHIQRTIPSTNRLSTGRRA